MLIRSKMLTVCTAGYNPAELPWMFSDGDLTISSHRDDELMEFLRPRKLIPLNCNGSEQLESS
jgi:hypothetical protein